MAARKKPEITTAPVEKPVLTDENQMEITIAFLAESMQNLQKEGITAWNAMNGMALVLGRAIAHLLPPEHNNTAYQHFSGQILSEMRNTSSQLMIGRAKAKVVHD